MDGKKITDQKLSLEDTQKDEKTELICTRKLLSITKFLGGVSGNRNVNKKILISATLNRYKMNTLVFNQIEIVKEHLQIYALGFTDINRKCLENGELIGLKKPKFKI